MSAKGYGFQTTHDNGILADGASIDFENDFSTIGFTFNNCNVAEIDDLSSTYVRGLSNAGTTVYMGEVSVHNGTGRDGVTDVRGGNAATDPNTIILTDGIQFDDLEFSRPIKNDGSGDFRDVLHATFTNEGNKTVFEWPRQTNNTVHEVCDSTTGCRSLDAKAAEYGL